MELQRNNDLEELVKSVAEPHLKELDEYIDQVNKELLQNATLTTELLEEFTLNIPTLIYYVINQLEFIGLQEDYAKLKKGEVYNEALRIAAGKVDEKRAIAEQEAQAMMIVVIVYNRAYKIMKSKVDTAYEILNSIKKVLTVRLAECELSNNKYSGRNKD